MKTILVAAMFMFLCLNMTGQEPLIYLDFNEGTGIEVNNKGTSKGTGSFELVDPSDNVTPLPEPEWSTNIPVGSFAPAENSSSLDFGETVDWRSVYFDVDDGLGTDGLAEFTITGWVNITCDYTGFGGRRIISTWPGGRLGQPTAYQGIDLVSIGGTRLRMGINCAPDFPDDCKGGPYSSENTLAFDAGAGPSNWRFFAVTYKDGNVTYYFGDGSTEVSMDALGEQAYEWMEGGKAVEPTAGGLAVGQITREAIDIMESTSPLDVDRSRGFCGFIDELRVYDAALALDDLKTIQKSPQSTASISNQTSFAVDIYPNPVNNILMVNFTGQALETQLTISTVSGKTVLVQTLYSRTNELNVEHLPEGIYFVMLESSKGIVHKKFIIK
jgi:hypothetical protein